MGRLAVITGASSGIGAAVAHDMASAGWDLCLIARRKECLETLANGLHTKFKTSVLVLPIDVTNSCELKNALKQIPHEVNCLVNSAGLARGANPVPDCTIADWEEMINCNVRALCEITLELLPRMPPGSTLVNLGSTAGTWPYEGGNVYGGTKAFVRQFSANLAIDLRKRGIRVTNIEPGIVFTEFSKVRYRGDEVAADNVYKDRLYLKPEDISKTITWVANLPPRMSVQRLEILPVTQAYGV